MGKKRNGEWFTEPVEQAEHQLSCPKCAALMTPEAVLCMCCGFNQLTSNYVDLPGNPARKKARKRKNSRIFKLWFPILLTIGAVAAIYTYFCYEAILLKHRHHLPKSLAYELPEHLDRPYNPLWLKDFKYKVINNAFEDIVQKEMQLTYPCYKHNEEVTLELVSGKTRSGIFKTANEKSVFLHIETEIFEIPFTTLKSKSRIRCDLAERKTIRDRVAHDRALTFLMGSSQQNNNPSHISRANASPILGKQEEGSQNKSLSN